MSDDTKLPLRGVNGDSALRMIMEGTAAETGERFFNALVESVAKALNTKGAWVTEYLEDKKTLRSIAFWFDGELVEQCEYAIAGTPCSVVIEEARLVHVPQNVVDLYPDDPDLEPQGAVSFMGTPLMDQSGRAMGHLAVIDSSPMLGEERIFSIIRIFAARAAAELERIKADSRVREREQKLGLLVDSAMDAIIELDNDMCITMMNSAAEKVFNCRAQDSIGNSLLEHLSEKSGVKLPGIAHELSLRPEGERYLWIPGGLIAKCSGEETFPAEATVSRFEMDGEVYHTVILRNVNDRIKAEKKILSLSEEAEYLREEVRHLQNSGEIIGTSEPLVKVIRDIKQVADTDANVLIQGETGTGKELIARALHGESGRKDNRLVVVNCAAIAPALIESELFGHEKGAFTGATAKREGRFLLADGGTIFLDEIGELPLDLQSKLLRVLQEREFEPLGGSKTIKVDVRVLCATNRDLLKEVGEGKFREDLYYRLNVFQINIPPLRDRKSDIKLLAASFIEKLEERSTMKLSPLTDEEIDKLKSYDWPGNIRELQNVIERAVITSENGDLNFEGFLQSGDKNKVTGSQGYADENQERILSASEIKEIERKNIVLALKMTGWKVSGEDGAAKLLGIPGTTLNSKIKAYGITKE